MEVYFPHLKNGVLVSTHLASKRTNLGCRMLLSVGVFCAVVLSIGYAYASTMNQQMIANEEKLKVEVCYELMVDINGVLFALTKIQKPYEMTSEQNEILKTLTIAWNNYCKN